MRTIWQDDTRRELQGRLATLTPDRRAQWGKMSAPEMVCHPFPSSTEDGDR